MPTITDPAPAEVAKELQRLASALDEELPAKSLDRNLLVATWNLREFGGLTEEWHAGADASPKRDLHSLLAITEIVSRFDVIALQEVQGSIKSLRHMLKVLGPDWAFTLTDVTRGARGGGERMAFVFDTRRAKMSGLAGELVVQEEWLASTRCCGPQWLLGAFPRSCSYFVLQRPRLRATPGNPHRSRPYVKPSTSIVRTRFRAHSWSASKKMSRRSYSKRTLTSLNNA